MDTDEDRRRREQEGLQEEIDHRAAQIETPSLPPDRSFTDSPFLEEETREAQNRLETLQEKGEVEREKIIELASQAVQNAREEMDQWVSDPDLGLVPNLSPTPGELTVSEWLVSRLEPWVEEVREDGFEQTKAPFSSLAEAAEWIEEESKQNNKEASDQSDDLEMDEIVQELKTLAERLQAYGHDLQAKILNLTLPYLKPDAEWNHVVIVCPGTFLNRLRNATERMAKATGFHQDHLVMHILTGQKPLRSKATVEVTPHQVDPPAGDTFGRNEVTVTFQPPSLSFDELRCVYNRIQKQLGLKNHKPLTEKNRRLLQVVNEMEDAREEKPFKEFWGSVKESWNSKYPEDSYDTYQGPYDMYKRVTERLEKLSSAAE